jgi:hypothetical protein
MYWSLTSVGSTHKTANAAANNASTACGSTLVSRNVVVENSTRDQGISLYPNPAKDLINISMLTKGVKNEDIIIADALGKLQPVKIIHTYSSLIAVDVASLQAGTYFVRIATAEGIKTFKFIKQ